MAVGIVVPLPAYTLDPAFIAKKAEELDSGSVILDIKERLVWLLFAGGNT